MAAMCLVIMYIVGFLSAVPLLVMCLIVNPLIIVRNYGNACCDMSVLSPCLWLTIQSCVIDGLSLIALIIFLVACCADGKCKLFYVIHAFLFYGFLIAWACVGGWMFFGNGPYSSCFFQELGKTFIANFACMLNFIVFGWILERAVLNDA